MFVCVCVSIVALSHITVVVDAGYLTLEEEYLLILFDGHKILENLLQKTGLRYITFIL